MTTSTRRPRIRRFFRGLVVVLAITAVTTGLNHYGWLVTLEMNWLDTLLRLHDSPRAEHVFVVSIDDEDYEELFDATSPLSRDVIAEALVAVKRGNPAVIVVDLATAPFPAELDAEGTWPAVVWALGAHDEPDEHHPGANYSLAMFPVDRDGVVRRHERQFHDHEIAGGPARSIAWAGVEAYCDAHVAGSEEACEGIASQDPHETLLMNLAGDRFTVPSLSLDDVLAAARGAGWANGPLKDKIVVIGGEFEASRDRHKTPVGNLYGVELVARVIEAELQGRGIRPAKEILMIGAEIFCGLLILLFHLFLPHRIATIATVVWIPLSVFAASTVLFYSAAYWVNFVPVTIGAAIDQIHSDASAEGH